jgi:NADH-quinone oxidoreductase subunit I
MLGVSADSRMPEVPPSRRTGGAGRGLIGGLLTTGRALLRPAHTQEYPDVPPELPPRSRGVIALLEENCTSCMLCARECPDWCIYIDSHKETVPATGGGRDRQRNVLDRFAIDFSLCMYCGICIEVCPFDALFWAPEFEYSEFDIRDLTHEKGRLGQWMASVPPPPALDPRAPQAREVGAANAAAEKVIAEFEAATTAEQPAARADADPADGDPAHGDPAGTADGTADG